jgi:hypothetical protein
MATIITVSSLVLRNLVLLEILLRRVRLPVLRSALYGWRCRARITSMSRS